MFEQAKAELEIGALKNKLSEAVEDGLDATRRTIKRSRRAAGDLVDETAHHIKRDPLRSVAITFGAGLGLGALIGWLSARTCCKNL